MVAHKPGDVPTAANFKFTEDRSEIKLGEGVWKTASGLRRYRFDIIDVRQGVTAAQAVVENSHRLGLPYFIAAAGVAMAPAIAGGTVLAGPAPALAIQPGAGGGAEFQDGGGPVIQIAQAANR